MTYVSCKWTVNPIVLTLLNHAVIVGPRELQWSQGAVLTIKFKIPQIAVFPHAPCPRPWMQTRFSLTISLPPWLTVSKASPPFSHSACAPPTPLGNIFVHFKFFNLFATQIENCRKRKGNKAMLRCSHEYRQSRRCHPRALVHLDCQFSAVPFPEMRK